MKSDNNSKWRNRLIRSDYRLRWGILIGVTILFTLILYPSLVTQKHSYNLGDVAERDIKAPIDFLIEDKEATEAKRLQAIEEIQTVYDHNTILSSKLSVQVESAFDDLRVLFEPKEEPVESAADPALPIPAPPSEEKPSVSQQVQQMKDVFEEKVGIPVSNGAYRILEAEEFSTQISDLITRILTEVLDNGVVANKDILLNKLDKGIVLRDINTKEESTVYSLKRFYGIDQAKTMVTIVGQPPLKDVSYTVRNLVVDFVQLLIQPNITLNISETEERKEQAADRIKPILYKIKAGEMLLREGERVTPVNLLKLKSLQTQTIKGNLFPRIFGAAMIMLCLLVTTYILNINQSSLSDPNPNKNLLFMASVLILFFFLARLSASFAASLTQSAPFLIPASSIAYGLPLAAGAMIICMFMGLNTALPFALVIAAGATVIFENRFDLFLYFFLSSAMATYWMQHCRERKVFIKAGAKLGLLNLVLAVVLDLYIADSSGVKIMWDATFAFLGGIGAGIVAAGLTPLFEISFDYMTDIKLLELANLDRPVLRRLMLEAPGTYHHSVIVGTMVEAAGSEIRANPLLAKVCGYYHDIGKVNKPLYFIENQPNGVNKHDKLAPSMSKHILISHVKDGVEMGKENKLGQVILDTIRQHHGTSVISYFFEKARKLQNRESVTEDDYRYPGPRPQTKEAGLVLLSDVVEASSRTLDNPTPSRIQGHVLRMMDKVFAEGQLDDCELTLKDLHAIAKSYIKILNGIHHHRIEYSENTPIENENGKNGSSDRKQAAQIQRIPGTDSRKGKSHLKRLGLS